MTDRYDDEQGGDERLHEYLCEYVDGTMDPAVRAAFEEFLARNPDLAEHVRRLSMTRSLLCSSRQCAQAPRTLQHRLQIEIARDQMGVETVAFPVTGLGRFATVTSFVGFAVLLGALVGTSLVSQVADPGPPSGATRADHRAAPSDAHGHAMKVRPAQMGLMTLPKASPASGTGDVDFSRQVLPFILADTVQVVGLRRTSAVP